MVTPSRASMDSQNAVPKFEVLCGDISGRRRVSQRSGVSVRADQAAAVGGHEVDDFRGGLRGGDGEIALVFTVLIIDHDQHLAGADVFYGFGDRSE